MIGWIDAGSGASGDMLLAAVIDAGVEVERDPDGDRGRRAARR